MCIWYYKKGHLHSPDWGILFFSIALNPLLSYLINRYLQHPLDHSKISSKSDPQSPSSRYWSYPVSMFMGNAFFILSSILVLNIVLSIYKIVKFVNFLSLVMTHDNLTLKTDSRYWYKISCGGSVKFYKTHGLLLCTFLVTYLLKEENILSCGN